jgi:hypothetical protein
MSIRKNDFVFLFLASNAFEIKEVRPPDFDLDTRKYFSNAEVKDRQLTLVISGRPTKEPKDCIRQLMDFIKSKTGGRLETIGSFCAIGSSDGCNTTLALGAAMKLAGAPQLSYIGVCDLPIMPSGRGPAIPDVGALQPIDPPEMSKAEGDSRAGSFFGSHPSLKFAPPPRVKLETDIDAKRRRNFYQIQGNHAKYFTKGKTPRGRFEWWWWSDMKDGEVHGVVDGWSNDEKVVSGTTDDDFHISICDRKLSFGSMMIEAADALADFPR